MQILRHSARSTRSPALIGILFLILSTVVSGNLILIPISSTSLTVGQAQPLVTIVAQVAATIIPSSFYFTLVGISSYSISSPTCTYSAGNIVSSGYTLNGDLLIFNMPVTLVNVALSLSNPTLTVSGLYNPAFSGAYDIKVRLSDSAGAILVDTVNSFEASDVKTSLNIVPLTTISKITLTSVSGIVNSSSGLTLSVTPSLTIPANQIILLSFPYNWDLTTLCCPIVTSTVSCTSSGVVGSTCTSSIASTTATITMTTSIALAAGTSYSITINGLTSAPSMAVYSSITFKFSVQSSISSASYMYQVPNILATADSTPNTLTISSATFSSSVIVNTIPSDIIPTFDISLTFTTPVSDTSYYLQLELPFDLTTTSSKSPTIIGSGVCKSSLTSYTITQSTSTKALIVFTSSTVFLPYSASNGFVCGLKIPYVKSGGYVNYPGTIAAKTYYSSAYGVDSGSTSSLSGFNINHSSIVSQSVLFADSAANQYLGMAASHSIVFQVSQPLSSSGYITVDFTNTYISFSSATCTSVTCSITGCSSSAYTCTIDQTAKKITIASLFLSDMSATFTVTITLGNIINPNSIRSSSYLYTPKISTYYSGTSSNNYLVESSDSSVTVWTQFSSYLEISLLPLSITTTASIIRANIGTLTISFTFSSFTLPANAKYTITFPSNSFSMESSTGFAAAWSTSSTDTLSLVTYDTTNLSITMSYTGSTKVGALIINIQNSILLPFSSNRVHVIAFAITDSSNNKIASGTANYSVSSLDILSSAMTITRSSINANSATQNGENALYAFTITNPKLITIQTGYLITITLPSFAGSVITVSNCASGTSSISTCSIAANILTLSITSGGFTTAINFILTVENILSFQPITFSAIISESNSAYQIYSCSTTTSNSLANTIDFTTTVSSVLREEYVIWKITLLTMTPTNHSIPSGAVVIIDFPGQFTEANLASASILCSCSATSLSSRRFTVTSSIVGLSTITISNVMNPDPQVASSDQFQVAISDGSLYSISNTIISTTRTDIRYVFNCSITCRTCDSTNQSTCLSCYSDKILQNGTCVSSCQSGYYKASSTQCSPCENNCSTCTSKTACLTCNTSYLFVTDSSTCVASCTAGYYQSDSYTCTKCDTKCTTCTQSNICQTCSIGYYKVQDQDLCVDSTTCTTTLSLFLKGGYCVPCQSPCATCSTSYNTCLTCLSALPYRQGTTCQSACNSGYYSDGGNNCVICDSLCTACSSSATNCSACISTASYYVKTCYATCPSNVPLSINGICTSCPTGCSTCTSLDTCQTCTSAYLLYKSSCVSTCPTNYTADSTSTNCIFKGITTIISENISSNKIIPFPFIIALAIWIILVLFSRNRYPLETQISASIVGFGSFLEFGAYLTFLILQTKNDSVSTSQNKLFIAAFILHYFFNIANLVLFFRILRQDKHFQYWLSVLPHRITHWLVRFSSLVCSHKVENVLFCGFFGFGFFKAKLASVGVSLLPYNILSGMSLFFVSLPMVVSAAMTCYYDDAFAQLFIEALEVIIISLILAVFQIINIKKPIDFFMDKTVSRNNNNRKSLEYLNVGAGYGFDGIVMQNRLNGSTYYVNSPLGKSSLNNHWYGADSDRQEFKFNSRYLIVGELEKPLTFEQSQGYEKYKENVSINNKEQHSENTSYYINNQDNTIEPIYKSDKEPGLVSGSMSSIGVYHSSQEMAESCNSRGIRQYVSKTIEKPSVADQVIKELSENDDNQNDDDDEVVLEYADLNASHGRRSSQNYHRGRSSSLRQQQQQNQQLSVRQSQRNSVEKQNNQQQQLSGISKKNNMNNSMLRPPTAQSFVEQKTANKNSNRRDVLSSQKIENSNIRNPAMQSMLKTGKITSVLDSTQFYGISGTANGKKYDRSKPQSMREQQQQQLTSERRQGNDNNVRNNESVLYGSVEKQQTGDGKKTGGGIQGRIPTGSGGVSNLNVSYQSQGQQNALSRSKSVLEAQMDAETSQQISKIKHLNETMRSKSGNLFNENGSDNHPNHNNSNNNNTGEYYRNNILGQQHRIWVDQDDGSDHSIASSNAPSVQMFQASKNSQNSRLYSSNISNQNKKNREKLNGKPLRVLDEDEQYFKDHKMIQKVEERSYPSSTPARQDSKDGRSNVLQNRQGGQGNQGLFYLANPMQMNSGSVDSTTSKQTEKQQSKANRFFRNRQLALPDDDKEDNEGEEKEERKDEKNQEEQQTNKHNQQQIGVNLSRSNSSNGSLEVDDQQRQLIGYSNRPLKIVDSKENSKFEEKDRGDNEGEDQEIDERENNNNNKDNLNGMRQQKNIPRHSQASNFIKKQEDFIVNNTNNNDDGAQPSRLSNNKITTPQSMSKDTASFRQPSNIPSKANSGRNININNNTNNLPTNTVTGRSISNISISPSNGFQQDTGNQLTNEEQQSQPMGRQQLQLQSSEDEYSYQQRAQPMMMINNTQNTPGSNSNNLQQVRIIAGETIHSQKSLRSEQHQVIQLCSDLSDHSQIIPQSQNKNNKNNNMNAQLYYDDDTDEDYLGNQQEQQQQQLPLPGLLGQPQITTTTTPKSVSNINPNNAVVLVNNNTQQSQPSETQQQQQQRGSPSTSGLANPAVVVGISSASDMHQGGYLLSQSLPPNESKDTQQNADLPPLRHPVLQDESIRLNSNNNNTNNENNNLGSQQLEEVIPQNASNNNIARLIQQRQQPLQLGTIQQEDTQSQSKGQGQSTTNSGAANKKNTKDPRLSPGQTPTIIPDASQNKLESSTNQNRGIEQSQSNQQASLMNAPLQVSQQQQQLDLPGNTKDNNINSGGLYKVFPYPSRDSNQQVAQSTNPLLVPVKQSQQLDFNAVDLDDFGRSFNADSSTTGVVQPFVNNNQNTRASSVVPNSLQESQRQKQIDEGGQGIASRDGFIKQRKSEELGRNKKNQKDNNKSNNKKKNTFFGEGEKEIETYPKSINGDDEKKENDNDNGEDNEQQPKKGSSNTMPVRSAIKNQGLSMQRRGVDEIFDPEESIRSGSELNLDFNEISPSDFNVLNQRYDEDIGVHLSQGEQEEGGEKEDGNLDEQDDDDSDDNVNKPKSQEIALNRRDNNNRFRRKQGEFHNNNYLDQDRQSNRHLSQPRSKSTNSSIAQQGFYNLIGQNNNNNNNPGISSFIQPISSILPDQNNPNMQSNHPIQRLTSASIRSGGLNPYGEHPQNPLRYEDVRSASVAEVGMDSQGMLSTTQGNRFQMMNKQRNEGSIQQPIRQGLFQQQQQQGGTNSSSLRETQLNQMRETYLGSLRSSSSNNYNNNNNARMREEYLDQNIDEVMGRRQSQIANNVNNNIINPAHSQNESRLNTANQQMQSRNSNNNNNNSNNDLVDKLKNMEKIYLSKMEMSNQNSRASSTQSFRKSKRPFATQGSKKDPLFSSSQVKDASEALAFNMHPHVYQDMEDY